MRSTIVPQASETATLAAHALDSALRGGDRPCTVEFVTVCEITGEIDVIEAQYEPANWEVSQAVAECLASLRW